MVIEKFYKDENYAHDFVVALGGDIVKLYANQTINTYQEIILFNKYLRKYNGRFLFKNIWKLHKNLCFLNKKYNNFIKNKP